MASFSNAGSDIFKEEWIKKGVEPQYGSYFVAVDLAGFEEVAKQAAEITGNHIVKTPLTEDEMTYAVSARADRYQKREN